ncbi:uncharacterized protein LOC142912498 isoform X7 [Petromyzon marinus]|uniref:uncharacterized protein LOC142912498 isoform X7 n=1 Tax=Petromyzon marinus TaxID=7757 RepID=UPI003F72DED3
MDGLFGRVEIYQSFQWKAFPVLCVPGHTSLVSWRAPDPSASAGPALPDFAAGQKPSSFRWSPGQGLSCLISLLENLPRDGVRVRPRYTSLVSWRAPGPRASAGPALPDFAAGQKPSSSRRSPGPRQGLPCLISLPENSRALPRDGVWVRPWIWLCHEDCQVITKILDKFDENFHEITKISDKFDENFHEITKISDKFDEYFHEMWEILDKCYENFHEMTRGERHPFPSGGPPSAITVESWATSPWGAECLDFGQVYPSHGPPGHPLRRFHTSTKISDKFDENFHEITKILDKFDENFHEITKILDKFDENFHEITKISDKFNENFPEMTGMRIRHQCFLHFTKISDKFDENFHESTKILDKFDENFHEITKISDKFDENFPEMTGMRIRHQCFLHLLEIWDKCDENFHEMTGGERHPFRSGGPPSAIIVDSRATSPWGAECLDVGPADPSHGPPGHPRRRFHPSTKISDKFDENFHEMTWMRIRHQCFLHLRGRVMCGSQLTIDKPVIAWLDLLGATVGDERHWSSSEEINQDGKQPASEESLQGDFCFHWIVGSFLQPPNEICMTGMRIRHQCFLHLWEILDKCDENFQEMTGGERHPFRSGGPPSAITVDSRATSPWGAECLDVGPADPSHGPPGHPHRRFHLSTKISDKFDENFHEITKISDKFDENFHEMTWMRIRHQCFLHLQPAVNKPVRTWVDLLGATVGDEHHWSSSEEIIQDGKQPASEESLQGVFRFAWIVGSFLQPPIEICMQPAVNKPVRTWVDLLGATVGDEHHWSSSEEIIQDGKQPASEESLQGVFRFAWIVGSFLQPPIEICMQPAVNKPVRTWVDLLGATVGDEHHWSSSEEIIQDGKQPASEESLQGVFRFAWIVGSFLQPPIEICMQPAVNKPVRTWVDLLGATVGDEHHWSSSEEIIQDGKQPASEESLQADFCFPWIVGSFLQPPNEICMEPFVLMSLQAENMQHTVDKPVHAWLDLLGATVGGYECHWSSSEEIINVEKQPAREESLQGDSCIPGNVGSALQPPNEICMEPIPPMSPKPKFLHNCTTFVMSWALSILCLWGRSRGPWLLGLPRGSLGRSPPLKMLQQVAINTMGATPPAKHKPGCPPQSRAATTPSGQPSILSFFAKGSFMDVFNSLSKTILILTCFFFSGLNAQGVGHQEPITWTCPLAGAATIRLYQDELEVASCMTFGTEICKSLYTNLKLCVDDWNGPQGLIYSMRDQMDGFIVEVFTRRLVSNRCNVTVPAEVTKPAMIATSTPSTRTPRTELDKPANSKNGMKITPLVGVIVALVVIVGVIAVGIIVFKKSRGLRHAGEKAKKASKESSDSSKISEAPLKQWIDI